MSTQLIAGFLPVQDWGGVDPINISPPTVSGNAWVGATLSYTPGVWSAGEQTSVTWEYTPSITAPVTATPLENGNGDVAPVASYLVNCWVRAVVQFSAGENDGEPAPSDWFGPIEETPIPPTIVASTSTPNVASGATAVGTLQATGATPITWTKTGGADADKFAIDAETGVVSFLAAPSWESPTDADANNVYVVEFTATNIIGSDSITLNVTVTNTVVRQGLNFGYGGGEWGF